MDNPILQVATLARTTGKIPFQNFSPTVRKIPKHSQEAEEIIDKGLAQLTRCKIPNNDVNWHKVGYY